MKEVSTGLPPEKRRQAQLACDLYALQKGAKERGILAPRMVSVCATLNYYLEAAGSRATTGAAQADAFVKGRAGPGEEVEDVPQAAQASGRPLESSRVRS